MPIKLLMKWYALGFNTSRKTNMPQERGTENQTEGPKTSGGRDNILNNTKGQEMLVSLRGCYDYSNCDIHNSNSNNLIIRSASRSEDFTTEFAVRYYLGSS